MILGVAAGLGWLAVIGAALLYARYTILEKSTAVEATEVAEVARPAPVAAVAGV